MHETDAFTERMASIRSRPETPPPPRSSSGSGLGAGFIGLALVFLIGPILVSALGVPLHGLSQILLTGFGLVLLLMGVIVTTITRLYHRAPADRAFVRTGMGGARVILDGGAMVIPVVHEVIWVSLRTMRFEVKRIGEDSLLTRDYLRADVTCEFFVRVPKESGAVLTAATSLGTAAVDPMGVQAVIEKKLDSAIRQVAAEMELTDLLVNRAEFLKRVSEHVASDIKNNGLELENVTLSSLDQTRTDVLRSGDNIFDAQGARKITEITTAQNVQQTQLRLEAQRRMKAEQVRTDQFEYEQEIARAAAEADRDRQVKMAQATAEQEAATKAAEQARLARIAELERDRAVSLADVNRQRELDVANQQREEATLIAEIAKQQALEVSNRQMDIAVAEKETERAAAQARQLATEAERARRAQEVLTVEVTAKADREKAQAVIAAQAEAEQTRVQEQMLADLAAYSTVKGAEAAQEAATLQASARLTQADADQKAKAMEAEGEKAVQLVPVEVERERVGVEQARVEVLKNELQTKAEHESISRGLQVDLARIEAERDVQVEAAKAFGMALSHANLTIWGDPETVAKMSQAFLQGQSASTMLSGFADGTSPELKSALGGLALVFADYAKRKFGVEIDPQQLEDELGGVAPVPNGSHARA
jgi:flotillin